MADRDAKGRTPRGESHPTAKVTEADVRQIRQLYADGVMNYRELGKKFGLDPGAVRHIIDRRTWKRVESRE